jgi:hypothetical protein
MVMEIRNHVFFFFFFFSFSIDVGHQYVHHSQQGIRGAKIKESPEKKKQKKKKG